MEPEFGDVVIGRDGTARIVQSVRNGYVYWVAVPFVPEGQPMSFDQVFDIGCNPIAVWKRIEKTGDWDA